MKVVEFVSGVIFSVQRKIKKLKKINMASLDTKNAKNNRNMREKYSFMSSHEIWRWFHPRGCKKPVKPSAKPRVLPVFATLGWNHLIFHGYSWKSLIFSHTYLCKIGFTHVRKPCGKFLSYMSRDAFLHLYYVTIRSRLAYSSSTKQQQWLRNVQYPQNFTL
jgi:hypothetical protein